MVRKINKHVNEFYSINSKEILVGNEASDESDETTNAHTKAAKDPYRQSKNTIEERKSPQRFTTSALTRLHNQDVPSVRIALDMKANMEWRRATHSEIETILKLECWDIVDDPSNQNIIHSKFLMKHRKTKKRA